MPGRCSITRFALNINIGNSVIENLIISAKRLVPPAVWVVNDLLREPPTKARFSCCRVKGLLPEAETVSTAAPSLFVE